MENLIAAVLAGGRGERLGHLTKACPKPLVPYAGACRMIDFSLQNCWESKVREVVLMSKHMELPLIRYLQSQWTEKVALNFGPYQSALRSGQEHDIKNIQRPDENGTADALLANRPYLDQDWVDDILVLHSDHIYNFDYRPMYAHHKETGAALTIGFQRIPMKYVQLFGMVQFDDCGNLSDFVEKPEYPTSDCIFTAVAIFSKKTMYAYLDDLVRSDWRHDISFDLIPALLKNGEKIVGFPFENYWEDIGTVERYFQAHIRFVEDSSHLQAPVTLAGGDTLIRVHGGQHENTLMPEALSTLNFAAKRSLIFPGARLSGGVVLEDVILLPDARLEAGEKVCSAVIGPFGRSTITAGANG